MVAASAAATAATASTAMAAASTAAAIALLARVTVQVTVRAKQKVMAAAKAEAARRAGLRRTDAAHHRWIAHLRTALGPDEARTRFSIIAPTTPSIATKITRTSQCRLAAATAKDISPSVVAAKLQQCVVTTDHQRRRLANTLCTDEPATIEAHAESSQVAHRAARATAQALVRRARGAIERARRLSVSVGVGDSVGVGAVVGAVAVAQEGEHER
eukprot:6208431-Pleurochrysis_carterae.AAC.1